MYLDDKDKMPFGAHKNIPMDKVPASYFHYLWTNGIKQSSGKDREAVAAYIERNLSVLKMEHRDGIWD